MISSVKITGYRAFPSFEMNGLGQVNLLVGRNNTGKTSILEALYILTARGDPSALWRIMTRRGESIAPDPSTSRNPQQELDVCHLFNGHALRLEGIATMATTNQSPARSLSFRIGEAKQEGNEALFAHIPLEPEGYLGTRLAMLLEGNPAPIAPVIPLTYRGGMRPETIQVVNNIAMGSRRAEMNLPQYLSTDSIPWNEMVNLWNTISLGPHQERAINALKVLESDLEGIAPAPTSGPYQVFPGIRGGLKVKLKKWVEPIPIGSLGEGIWRMLALAIVASKAKDSLLLVDEIDTGFHHSVMSDMWKMIVKTASDLNVQVFATTHSYDCVVSLAKVAHESGAPPEKISIHRIETGHTDSTRFSEEQVRIAAARKLEIR